MNKEFIPYEQSLELKELGFDEPCLAFYNGKFLESTGYDFDNDTSKDIGFCIVAPLYQQAFRWFREKYNIACYTETKSLTIGGSTYDYTIIADEEEEWDDGKRWRTYEEAELACLKKLIEIVKKQIIWEKE
jgi:hypothetical protein